MMEILLIALLASAPMMDCSRCPDRLEIWLLEFWSDNIGPFEGGQYQDELRCKKGAENMLPFFRRKLGPTLQWECKKTRI